ncbi:MAG: lytic transglycosylase domain-containing protein, partial [Chrysiogenales bacterium]
MKKKKKSKSLRPLLFVAAGVLVQWLAIMVLVLVFQWQRTELKYKRDNIKDLSLELRDRARQIEKLRQRTQEYPQLKYLQGVFEAYDGLVYKVALAARAQGEKYKIDPFLILSVIQRESYFNPRATSYKFKRNYDGTIAYDEKAQHIKLPLAMGLMQVNYGAWKDELQIDLKRIYEVNYNLELGCRILDHYIQRNPGDLSRALYEYCSGFMADGNFAYPARV